MLWPEAARRSALKLGPSLLLSQWETSQAAIRALRADHLASSFALVILVAGGGTKSPDAEFLSPATECPSADHCTRSRRNFRPPLTGTLAVTAGPAPPWSTPALLHEPVVAVAASTV